MKTRIIAGLAAAIILVYLIYYTPVQVVMSVVLLFAVMSYVEFDKLFFPNKVLSRQVGISVMILLTVLSIRHNFGIAWWFFWGCYTCLGLSQVFRASQNETMTETVHVLSLEFLGYIYVVGLFGFIIPILEIPGNGHDYLLLLFLLVFFGDTAAYFAGKKLGRHPLASKISPKKTIEGSVAAVLSTFLVTGIWLKWIYSGVITGEMIWKLMLFVPVLSGLAQLGDLFESVLKRSQGKKDSGIFLPGHGGILDRIDGLAFTTPVFYFFITRVLERTFS